MCGVFGVYGHKESSRLTYLGLYALQHRGEESAGVVSYDGRKTYMHKGMGLVREVFSEDKIKSLHGSLSVGHNRYSTTGSSSTKNIQPFFVNYRSSPLAVAHNGNFTNTNTLHRKLEASGSIFQTTMDSEIAIHLIAKYNTKNYKEAVVKALGEIEGAYSLVLMMGDMVIGARDPYGWRPLCLGKVDGAYVIASETCALDLIGAEYIRDIEPGEIIFINKNGIESVKPFLKKRKACCIFEYIYFSRPDSNIFGQNVYSTRKELGRQLAKECSFKADLVTPVPDSGVYAAVGFAQKTNIPFEMGMIRNHYVGRTFIQPAQSIRDFRVKVKLNPIKSVLKDKEIMVVEDSIVRGTTSRGRVRALRDAGVKKIHMLVSCPPLRFPCFYGIDFPTKKELIASEHDVEWIRNFIGVDTLYYLSKEGMLGAMPLPKEDFCTACFDGNYPVKPEKRLSKNVLERK